jgi:hypothetical protein
VLLPVAVLVGCVTVTAEPTRAPTFAATPLPTDVPTPEPVSTPAPIETPVPTPEPPSTPAGTPDPNATPRPTPVDVLPFLSAEVVVVNLADRELSLTVALLDPDSDAEFVVGTFDLQPEQVTAQAVVPTIFRLAFALDGGSSSSCIIEIGEGEQVQFAVVAGGIAITSSLGEPADVAEMLVATSSRCQAEAAS